LRLNSLTFDRSSTAEHPAVVDVVWVATAGDERRAGVLDSAIADDRVIVV